MSHIVRTSRYQRLARGARKALCPLSGIYLLVVAIRLRLYKYGLFKIKKLNCPVISVGNLTAGGTGKSECVAMAAAILAKRSIRATIISRGYKGGAEGRVNVVSDGQGLLMGPDQAGDEPCMLGERITGVPIVVGKDKWAAGALALEKFGPEALLLDDGYQHLRLWRDLNILLVDASDPIGNGLLLPAGELREPLSGVNRADAIIFTRWGERDETKVKRFLDRCAGAIPVFKASYEPSSVDGICAGSDLDLRHLPEKKIITFCGIARPGSFMSLIAKLGCQVMGGRIFKDHHPYRRKDLDGLLDMARSKGAELCLTTPKDLIKVKRVAAAGEPFFALRVSFKLIEGESNFIEMLLGAIKSWQSARSAPV